MIERSAFMCRFDGRRAPVTGAVISVDGGRPGQLAVAPAGA